MAELNGLAQAVELRNAIPGQLFYMPRTGYGIVWHAATDQDAGYVLVFDKDNAQSMHVVHHRSQQGFNQVRSTEQVLALDSLAFDIDPGRASITSSNTWSDIPNGSLCAIGKDWCIAYSRGTADSLPGFYAIEDMRFVSPSYDRVLFCPAWRLVDRNKRNAVVFTFDAGKPTAQVQTVGGA